MQCTYKAPLRCILTETWLVSMTDGWGIRMTGQNLEQRVHKPLKKFILYGGGVKEHV